MMNVINKSGNIMMIVIKKPGNTITNITQYIPELCKGIQFEFSFHGLALSLSLETRAKLRPSVLHCIHNLRVVYLCRSNKVNPD